MSPKANQVLADALKLSPLERAELIEEILASFSFPDRKAIDERWGTEAEARIDAHDGGEIESRPANEVFARIEKGETG
jgi:putative addiction module component (TIGR02574 family)